MAMAEMAPPGPWVARESGPTRGREELGPSYIEVRGPNGEAICTIFPHAGKGGVGLAQARAIAAMIVAARTNPLLPKGGRGKEE